MDGNEQPCITKKRVRLQLTVAPVADQRLERLAGILSSNKGRLIDKLTECLDQAYTTGRQHCITGRPCKLDLTDLPQVF